MTREKKEMATRQQMMQVLEDDSEGVVEYLMKHHDNFTQFLENRNAVLNDEESATFNTITQYLDMLDISKSMKGFEYLREAILFMMMQDEDYETILLTRDIYPYVAKEFYTTISSVERGICYAIQDINEEKLQDKLGYKFSPNQSTIYKEEFIAFIDSIVNLCQKVQENLKDSEVQSNVSDVFEVITAYLQDLSVPRNLKGYNYLREAILMYTQIEDGEFVKITKDIYPEIAKKYNATCGSVERAIRHIKEKKINMSNLENIYGYNIAANGKISNSEFIAISASIVKMHTTTTVQEVECTEEFKEKEKLAEITKYLQEMAIPRHIMGFEYLREAIMICIKHKNIPFTKELYPQVAEKFNTTANRVERAIRHAIEVGFERAENDAIEKIFGYTYSSITGKTTNSEFIAMIADLVKNGE